MKITSSRKANQDESWPRKVKPGRAVVSVYRRLLPSGKWGYLVANYCDEKTRRLDAYPTEQEALQAAERLAQRIDSRDYVAASMTEKEAKEFASAQERLKPYGVTVDEATSKVVECLKLLKGIGGNLRSFVPAVENYVHSCTNKVTRKRVAAVVDELIAARTRRTKKGKPASARYLSDLRSRLNKFAEAFAVDISTVTTADVQHWLDRLDVSPQTEKNFRTVLNTLFTFAEKRHYIAKGGNPIPDTEEIQASNGKIEIFTPDEITKLLAAASADFLPVIALGAFAGLRAAEVERLEWRDIDLAGAIIEIGEEKAKTRSHRSVPILPNLAQWLAPYAKHSGLVWKATANDLCDARAATVKAADVKWKNNGLRHSFISYRLAEIKNAAQVALEAGNSQDVLFRHYRKLVKLAGAAKAWFAVSPEQPANVLAIAAARP